MSGRMCSHAKTVGFVTNQDPDMAMDWDRAHVSVSVCSRAECLRNALRWVAAETNETAAFYPHKVYKRGAP